MEGMNRKCRLIKGPKQVPLFFRGKKGGEEKKVIKTTKQKTKQTQTAAKQVKNHTELEALYAVLAYLFLRIIPSFTSNRHSNYP